MNKSLLITGIPGTGKTETGDFLRDNHGYDHLDIEVILNTGKFGPQWLDKVEEMIKNNSSKTGTVVTWGFRPPDDVAHIERLRSTGLTMFWFDGNRTGARKAFNERGTVQEVYLDIQLKFINQFDIKGHFNPIVYNSFDEAGSFKPKKQIVEEILDLLEKDS